LDALFARTVSASLENAQADNLQSIAIRKALILRWREIHSSGSHRLSRQQAGQLAGLTGI
jgi:hypothetical protein